MTRAAALSISLLISLSAFATASLQIVAPDSMSEDGRAEWRVIATNRGAETIEDFPLQMWTNVSIASMPEEICAAQGQPRVDARCVFDLPAGATRELVFTAKYDRTFGRFTGQVLGGALGDLYERDEALFGPEYAVTSVADRGAGSLRQAILDVNRDCKDDDTPCVITFALDLPQPITLRPETALPPVTAPAVRIDGRSRVVLDGSATTEGHGLLLEGSRARVTGLAIRGFHGNGIEANGFASNIRYNDLGPNGLRGVQVNGGESLIFDNVISGNVRAGGFFWSSREVRARRNVVTHNGASGLFFHKTAVSRIASYAQDNVLAFNAHAGLALSMTAEGEFAQNTFHGNRGGAIDVGLDGDTRELRDGLPGQGGLVGAPILISARFDGTATIITGRLAPRGTRWLLRERVTLYASPEPDAATEVLAVVDPEELGLFRDLTFTARIARDLRGQWIHAVSAATYGYNWDDFARGTSELSVPLPVE